MQDVKTLRRWMVFKLTQRPNGSVDKQPLSVLGGFASSNDPATWASYEDARKYCVEHNDCQLGFVLGEEVGLAVVDIDRARTAKDQPWPVWVDREVAELDSFVEESVSGLGLHVWVWATVPANMNRQKLHVEVHGSKKMFVVTEAFAERWEEIQPRDLTELCRRIEAGQIGPKYRQPVMAFAYNEPKFRALMEGRYTEHFADRSVAVMSCLCTLATKHAGDEEKIRAEFEASKMCEAWSDKWPRLADSEIEHAIKWWKDKQKQDKQALNVPLQEWALPAVEGGDDDFVLLPQHAEFDGWWPRGAVSIIAGASGAGKTSLMTVLLDTQRAGKPFLGHGSLGLDFLTIFFDRKRRSAVRTLRRLGLEHAPMPMEFCSVMWGNEAVQTILQLVEQHGAPPVVFVEGGDMIVQKPNDISYVSPFVTRLQEIAERYHIALILSLGSPKKYEDRKVVLSRDNIFGSQVWGRMTDTVAVLNHSGDGTEETRQLVVQHRDAPTEKFDMQFINGRLMPQISSAEDIDSVALWAREQGSWFADKEAQGAFEKKIRSDRVFERLEGLARKGRLDRKFVNGAFQYRWKVRG